MNYCKHCGTKLSEGQKFCTNCGNKIENNSVNNPENKPAKKPDNSVNNPANDSANNPVNNPINNLANDPVNNPVNNREAVPPKMNNQSNFGPPDSFNANIRKGKSKKRGGCLRIFLISFGVLIVLFIGLVFIGNDQDNTGDDIDYNALNELDFYNIKEIPVLETDEELNEYYLPYIVRGVSERYADVMDESLDLLSEEYISNTSYDEYKQKVSELLYNFEQVEMMSVTFQGKLAVYEEELEQASRKNSFNIPFTVTAYAWTKDEVYEVVEEAREKGISKINYLAQHLGTSARNAHKVLMMCNEISESEYYSDDNDRMEWVDRGREAMELAGKGARVYITYATGGMSALVGNSLAIISSADLVLEATEKGAFIAFGDNPNVKALTAPISTLRNNKYYQVGMGVVSLLSLNVNNSGKVDFKGNIDFGKGAELFNNMFSIYDIGKDTVQGKVIGIDLKEMTINQIDDDEITIYMEEKGLVDDTEYVMTDDEYEKYKGLDNYEELSNDEFIAYMNKRNEEIWVEQDNLSGNLDNAISDLENTVNAYGQGNNSSNTSGTNISGTNISGTNISGTNTSGTNISGTNINGTNTSGTNTSGTNISGTNANSANTSGTNTNGTDTNNTNSNDGNASTTSEGMLSVVNFVDRSYNGQIAVYGGSFSEDGGRTIVDVALYSKDGMVEQVKVFMGIEVLATWAQEDSLDTYISTEDIYKDIVKLTNAEVIDTRNIVDYSAMGVMVHFKNNSPFDSMIFTDIEGAIKQLKEKGYTYVTSYNMD